jgi:hypothetical protein
MFHKVNKYNFPFRVYALRGKKDYFPKIRLKKIDITKFNSQTRRNLYDKQLRASERINASMVT